MMHVRLSKTIGTLTLFGALLGISALGNCDDPVKAAGTPPPGGGGGGGGGGGVNPPVDDNPANPANWVIGAPVRNGQLVASRVELRPGGPTRISYSFPWTPPSGGTVPVAMACPFVQVYGSDDITMDTAGSVSRTIHWRGLGQAPSQVNLRVRSYTMVTWAHNFFAGGEGEVSNGLDGMPVHHLDAACPEPIFDTPTWELRVLEVDSATGNATLTVSSSANVRGGGSQAAVWAIAGQVDAAIDDRTVTLDIGSELNYRKGSPDGTTTYTRTIHTYVDPTSDADGSQWRINWNNGIKNVPPPNVHCTSLASDVTRQFPKILPELNKLIYTSGLTSHGMLDFGLVVQHRQEIHTPGSSEYTHIPSSIPPAIINYRGTGTSKGIASEHYRYTVGEDSLAGDLPDSGIWTVPLFPVEHTCKLWTESLTIPDIHPFEHYAMREDEPGDGGGSDFAKFEYRWPDGTRGVASRVVRLHDDPDEQFPLDSIEDEMANRDFEGVPFTDDQTWATAGCDGKYVMIKAPKRTFNVLQAGGWVTIVACSGLAAAGVISWPLTVSAGVACAVLSIATSAPNAPDVPSGDLITVQFNMGYCRVIGPDGWWRSFQSSGDTEWAMINNNKGAFNWQILANPKANVSPRVTDRWGANGFIKQEVVEKVDETTNIGGKRYYWLWSTIDIPPIPGN
jgi:hypothetical protein